MPETRYEKSIRGERLVCSTCVVEHESGNTDILFDTERDQIYAINPVGAEVWAMFRVPSLVEDVLSKVCSKFDHVPCEDVRRDCLEFIRDALDAGLLNSATETHD